MPDDTNTRSVRFREDVDRVVYTPEPSIPVAPSSPLVTRLDQVSLGGSSATEEESKDIYRDGIHFQLRVPSVIFDLSGLLKPADVFHTSILNAPATSSYIHTFLISSRSFPWKIIVPCQHGYPTVKDVLTAIIQSLQRPAGKELHALQQTDLDLFHEVEKRRKRRVENKLDEYDTSARRIDWLPLKDRLFFGLSSEKGSVVGSTERILKVRKKTL